MCGSSKGFINVTSSTLVKLDSREDSPALKPHIGTFKLQL